MAFRIELWTDFCCCRSHDYFVSRPIALCVCSLNRCQIASTMLQRIAIATRTTMVAAGMRVASSAVHTRRWSLSAVPSVSLHSFACTSFSPSSTPKPAPPAGPFDLDSSLSQLGSSFADARMDIEDAIESLGTTYYPSDIQAAIDSVNSTLLQFESIQTTLGPSSPQATKLRESWSLRLEQLKQELQQAIEKGGGEEH